MHTSLLYYIILLITSAKNADISYHLYLIDICVKINRSDITMNIIQFIETMVFNFIYPPIDAAYFAFTSTMNEYSKGSPIKHTM